MAISGKKTQWVIMQSNGLEYSDHTHMPVAVAPTEAAAEQVMDGYRDWLAGIKRDEYAEIQDNWQRKDEGLEPVKAPEGLPPHETYAYSHEGDDDDEGQANGLD